MLPASNTIHTYVTPRFLCIVQNYIHITYDVFTLSSFKAKSLFTELLLGNLKNNLSCLGNRKVLLWGFELLTYCAASMKWHSPRSTVGWIVSRLSHGDAARGSSLLNSISERIECPMVRHWTTCHTHSSCHHKC